MEPGTPAGDAHSTPHHEPSSADSEHAAPHGASTHPDVKVPIKEEAAAAALDGIDDAGVTPRPAKRRRVESSTSRSTSRAASPPWKSFSAHGPTTVFENGVRKSSRVNRDALPPTPEPAKRAARHAPKTPQANGAPKSGTPKSAAAAKKLGPSNGVKKPIPAPANKAFAPASSTPASRKSERQRRPPAPAPARASPPTSPVLRHASPEGARKRTARTRRATHTSTQDTADHVSMTDPHDPDGGLYAESLDLSASAPRLRLKLRKLDPPRRHPLHAPPAAKLGSLEAFLAQDDPLEGEEAQRITDKKAVEEAQRRMRIEDAAERGVLSQAVCSVFAPEPAPEPPQQYGHWDHVTAHALHFGRLLFDEKRNHRRMAKVLAREAQDRWAIKYKRKS